MSQARDWDWHGRWGGIGFTVYPYQLALGISLRYWPCLFAPAFRLHVGPFKVWGYVTTRRFRDARLPTHEDVRGIMKQAAERGERDLHNV